MDHSVVADPDVPRAVMGTARLGTIVIGSPVSESMCLEGGVV